MCSVYSVGPTFMSDFEAVIGLEVHVQIKTASKMFTRVATGYGEPPNTLTDPTILALPGALPVLNKAALDAIIKTGLMLDCEIATVTRWDRKNYFYPDSPKNYQLSQYDQPVCRHGAVEIELPGASLATTLTVYTPSGTDVVSHVRSASHSPRLSGFHSRSPSRR